MRLPTHTQSATVRTCTGRPVAGPNAPLPRCVMVDAMRCDERKPPSASPALTMSSHSSRRSGNCCSVSKVPRTTASTPWLVPAGVMTAQSSL